MAARLVLVVCLIGALCYAAPAGASLSNVVDTGWGNAGIGYLPSGRVPRSPAGAVLPDGSLLVATNLGVTKLLSTGAVDTSYGTSGSTDAAIDATTILVSNGGAVLVGLLDPGSAQQHAGVVKLLPNGQVDTSFASGGTLSLNAPGPVVGTFASSGDLLLEYESFNGVDLQAYGASGAVDPSFAGGNPVGILVESPGPIVPLPTGGAAIIGGGLGLVQPEPQELIVVSPTGAITTALPVNDPHSLFTPRAADLTAAGELDVVGDTTEELVRMNATLDPGFGEGICGDPLAVPAQPGGTLALLHDGLSADVSPFGPQSYDIVPHVVIRDGGRRDLTFGDGGTTILPGLLAHPVVIASDNSAMYLEDQNANSTVPLIKVSLAPSPVIQRAPAVSGSDWLIGSDGGVLLLPGPFGTPPDWCGSTGAMRLNQPVVGGALEPDGVGYWLVARDGGVFTFGDTVFRGSTGAMQLNQPVVGMAPTPDGQGYWLVAADGGIFSFGDAHFWGSTGAIHLVAPIVGMVATPDGRGYYLVARDGGIFNFGDALYMGSAAPDHPAPVVGIELTRTGNGYRVVASNGSVYTFGDAGYGGNALQSGTSPVVAVAPGPPDTFTVVQADGTATNSDYGPIHLGVVPASPIVAVINAD